MKRIGLIGGMSWASTLDYYRLLNELVQKELGKPHSAEIIMHSVDFAPFKRLQHRDEWGELTSRLKKIARNLEQAGADMVLICANTMHRMAPELEGSLDIPLLHIADAAGAAIEAEGLKQVALLGTRFTMEGDFYSRRLVRDYGLEIMIPGEENRERIHEIIYEELISDTVSDRARSDFRRIIDALSDRGAEGVILGCTELPMLVDDDIKLPLFDTTRLHAEMAVRRALI